MQIKRLSAFVTFFLSALILLSFIGTSDATTIDPIPWEEFALGSDFIGVVECTTAGVITAEYKVIESMKGEEKGNSIRIMMAVDTWGAPFPIVLTGERFFVMAFRGVAPSNIMSTTSVGGFPLWGRAIKYDYVLPLHQGMVSLPDKEGWQFSLGAESSNIKDFDDLLEQVKSLAAMEKNKAELLLIQKLFYKEVSRGKGIEFLINELKSQQDHTRIQFINSVSDADTSAGLIDILAGASKGAKPLINKWSFLSIVSEGILTQETFSHIKKILNETEILAPQEKEVLLAMIEFRIIPDRKGMNLSSLISESMPTTEDLDRFEAMMKKGFEDDLSEAFTALTLHRPNFVADWLGELTPPEDVPELNALGYGMASFFAIKCPEDRETYLTKLLKANDPYIRVTAAVYLSIDGNEEGLAWLDKFQNLDGAPGLWASLNLARRGDKEAMDRILLSMSDIEEKQTSFIEGMIYGSLFARTLVLLSNSAASSGIDVAMLSKVNESNSFGSITAWWKKNKSKITLRDPWLTELAGLKID